MTFKDRILKLIEGQKPTPWGTSVGLLPATTNRIFKDGKIPKYEALLKISNALNVSVDYLLTGKEPEYSEPPYPLELKEMIRKLTKVYEQKDRVKIDTVKSVLTLIETATSGKEKKT